MDKAYLVGVHEAGIAHHVAAVRQVDRQHRAAAVLDGARSVIVQALVIVGANVAAGEVGFNPVQELGVNGHHVFKVAVLGAILQHPDLAVALDDVGLDLAGLLGEQRAPVLIALDDPLARFADALRAERIGFARPAQRGLGLLMRLQERLVGPLGNERAALAVLVEELDAIKHDAGS